MLARIAVFLILTVEATCAQTSQKQVDVVPDEKTAVRIAEAVLAARFGEDCLKTLLPLSASPSGRDVWIVSGGKPKEPPQLGGGMAVMIQKHTGCMSILEHMK